MTQIFNLKDINFSAFADKLKNFSDKFGIYQLQVQKEKITFRTDKSLFGLGFGVEIEKIDDQTFFWDFDQGAIVGLILVFAIILFVIFKNNLVLWLAITALVSFLIVLANRKSIEKNLLALFEQIVNFVPPQNVNKQNNDLVCPACGEPLTPYDEFCPSCGLYLGKSWKKQPAHRTDLFDKRLIYNYKPSKKPDHSAQN